MTDTEQRVAIAEWLGWSCIEDCGEPLMMPEGIVLRGYPPEGALVGKKIELPDFLNDLNAVHEVESKLIDNDKARYYWLLTERVNPNHLADKCTFDLVHATAAQRCEALLRCVGLWRD